MANRATGYGRGTAAVGVVMKADLAHSKRDELKSWMKAKQVFRTHEVIQFGLDHYFNRALREKGQLHHDGIIRALTTEEKGLRGITGKEAAYSWVGEPTEETVQMTLSL